MITIMDFSDEVLVNIAYHLLPDGIEAFSKCSKRFSTISKDALIQHQTYKQKYSDIEIKMNEGAGQLLIEMLQDPRRTEYIRQVDFEYCFETLRVPLNEDVAKTLTLTLLQQPCVSPTGVPLWVRKAMSGDQDFIIAALVLLLPRLETLFVPTAPFCELIIRKTVKWAQRSVFRRPMLSLARLESVRIGDNQWNPAQPGQFFVDHGIRIFQGLPSLRDLLCFFRTTRALDNPCIIMQLCNESTALHVLDLELSAEDLEIILQHVSNVTEFTYIDRYFSNVVRNLDQTLQKYAGASLEDLVLKCVPAPMLDGPNHGFTSLKGFSSLKRVTISQDTVRTLWNRSSSRPTMVEFLPASITDVTVVGPTDIRLASLVLDEVAEAKWEHFPGLKSLFMSQIESLEAPKSRALAENAGIVLALDDEDEDDDEEDEDEDDYQDDNNKKDENDDDVDMEGNDEIALEDESK